MPGDAPSFTTPPSRRYGPKTYLADKRADLAAIARDVRRHPGCLPQDLLALFSTLLTFGGNRLAGPGNFVLYSSARGFGTLLPRLAKHTAITLGNIAFARATVRQYSALYWHEETHYLQSLEQGWRWGPRYFRESRRHGYRKNNFEVEAYDRGRRCAGQETCDR